jgi:hypothetical protein
VIVLPHVPPRPQHAFLRWVAPIADLTFRTRGPRFGEVSTLGQAIAYRPERGFHWDARPGSQPTISPPAIH